MHIEILTDESYDEFVAENEEAMIFWVAEGCIRCFEIVQVCRCGFLESAIFFSDVNFEKCSTRKIEMRFREIKNLI